MASASVVPVVGVSMRGLRLPVRRPETTGRSLVVARSGIRPGRKQSKIARESILANASKREKAYGYGYGYSYGWSYGHEYGDEDWGHVTGVVSVVADEVVEPKTLEPWELVALQRQMDSEKEFVKNADPINSVDRPKLAPVQDMPPPPPKRAVPTPMSKQSTQEICNQPASKEEADKLWKSSLPKTKTISAKEIANKLNRQDMLDTQKRQQGSFTYSTGADGTLMSRPKFEQTIRMTSPARQYNGETSNGSQNSPNESKLIQLITGLTNLFPIWVLLGALVGMTSPNSVTWFKGDMITHALATTMLGMGLTLEFDDFVSSLKKPKQIGLGVLLQYTIMPTLGLLIGKVFPVHASVAVGLILVGCCPGGTASNVVTYLGKANVALSVVLTTASTFLASFMTPLMTKTLAGTLVPVDAVGLAKSTASVVLAPIIVGLLLKKTAPRVIKAIAPVCPLVAVATVALICSSIIGSSSAAILDAGPALFLAVITLHTAGFGLGYFASKTLGFPERDSRTVSIEVGMQNSALGVVLAAAHFADPLVAVPCAISATVHSCVGSMIAGTWRLRDQLPRRN